MIKSNVIVCRLVLHLRLCRQSATWLVFLQAILAVVCWAYIDACDTASMHARHTHQVCCCVQEYNDAMLTVFLSSITKGTQNVLEVVDKYCVTYDKSQRRRGPAFDTSFMHG